MIVSISIWKCKSKVTFIRSDLYVETEKKRAAQMRLEHQTKTEIKTIKSVIWTCRISESLEGLHCFHTAAWPVTASHDEITRNSERASIVISQSAIHFVPPKSLEIVRYTLILPEISSHARRALWISLDKKIHNLLNVDGRHFHFPLYE